MRVAPAYNSDYLNRPVSSETRSPRHYRCRAHYSRTVISIGGRAKSQSDSRRSRSASEDSRRAGCARVSRTPLWARNMRACTVHRLVRHTLSAPGVYRKPTDTAIRYIIGHREHDRARLDRCDVGAAPAAGILAPHWRSRSSFLDTSNRQASSLVGCPQLK